MDKFKNDKAIGAGEQIVLMAFMISLTAMSIDTILPALADIGRDLGVLRPNDNQLVVSLLILGMAVGQMIYGPLSDSVGRKPAIYMGFGLYMGGCLLSLTANVFYIMLAGRVLQGLGAAGPRIVTMALVRDQYQGRAMARVMSIILSVFILVPVVAPTLGQAILLAARWRAIFGVFIVMTSIALVWFALRQPETLAPDRRIPFSPGRILKGVLEVCSTRVALGYTLAAGFVYGAFFGYLNSAQQIFQGHFGLGTKFPLFFGGLALSIGGALFFNTRLVTRFGMRLLTRRALMVIVGFSIFYGAVAWAMDGSPTLSSFMIFMSVTFFCIGLLFGNLNAIAMQPLGHIAGVGAAVVGSLSTLISVPLGILVGQFYDGTVLPLIAGFALFGSAALITVGWTERPKETRRASRKARLLT